MSKILLARGRWLIADAAIAVPDGAVAVKEGRILEAGPWPELQARHPGAEVVGDERMAVMPGFVNAHHHSHGVSGLQQGVPDLLLELWLLKLLCRRPTDIHLNTLLSCGRLLQTGVTTVVEVHSDGADPDAYARTIHRALEAYDKSGIRVAFASGIKTQSRLADTGGDDEAFLASLPAGLRAKLPARLTGQGALGVDDYFAVMAELHGAYRQHPRIDVWFAPPGPHWVSDAVMRRMADQAEALDTGIQTHVSESLYEAVGGPRHYGRSVVEHLHGLGVLGPRFSLAHGVWLSAAEIDLLAETGAAVAHNPSSNLRLRAGVAPLNALLQAGVTAALGMDGTTINDDEDYFAEMRLALRLQRTPEIDGPVPSTSDILAMATTGGARMLRQERRLGRIAPGYAADLVLVDLTRPSWPWIAPELDPRDLVMLRAKAGDVHTVLVDGCVVLRDGRPTGFDMEAAGRELAERLCREARPAEAAALVDELLPHVEAHYRGWPVPKGEPFDRR